MGVHEVGDWQAMSSLSSNRSIFEHLINMLIGSDPHILLTQVLDMSIDVGILELLGQRDLLEWHAMDTCGSSTKQRGCGDNRSLHDCDGLLMGWAGMGKMEKG